MSKAHMPPVPPANRSDKGPGGDGRADPAAAENREARGGGKDGNTAEQGRAGNTKQNTTHQGLQQDR
jgi:hypothetical protein